MGIQDLRLSHYSRFGDKFYFSKDYEYIGHQGHNKPIGFWVSVDGEDDWPSWCEGEGFATESLEYHKRVVLSKDANILHIKTWGELLALEARIADKTNQWAPVDWSSIYKEYDGIIIAPYQSRVRGSMDAFFYWGWDCASGCIWNLNVIDSVFDVNDVTV